VIKKFPVGVSPDTLEGSTRNYILVINQMNNFHKTLEQRMPHDTPYQQMTRFDDKYNNHATNIVTCDRYKGAFPWSNRLNTFNQDNFREPSNRFGYRFIENTHVIQRYAPGGMLNQLHAGASTGDEMRTLPTRPKYCTNL
jgi:hypothetical protein